MATQPKVSERSTKKELLSVIKSMRQELENQEPEVDKKTELKLVQEKEIVKKATVLSVEEIIKTFRVQINGALSGFESQLLEKKSNLDTVQEAIKLEEQNLKDIYQIGKEADTLQILLKAQQKEKSEFETYQAESKDQWHEEATDHSKSLIARNVSEEKERKRRLEEHTYQWKTKTDREKDDYEESKRIQQRELKFLKTTVEEALASREDAVKAQEDGIADLKANVAAFPTVQQEAIEEAVAKALKSEKTSRHFEVSTLKKDHEASKTVYESHANVMALRLDELTVQNKDLTTKLESAYTEVRKIATEAIQGAAQAKVVVTQDSKPVTK